MHKKEGAPDAASSTCDDDGFAFEAAHEFLPVVLFASASAALRNSNRISNAKSLETMRALTYSDNEHY